MIPSIDLMGGKIVQLVQGETMALEIADFSTWAERFRGYPVVQLIDLDAAMGKGANRALVEDFCRRLPCQVGGGIRTAQAAAELLECGARRVILSSALINKESIDVHFASHLAAEIGAENIVVEQNQHVSRRLPRPCTISFLRQAANHD